MKNIKIINKAIIIFKLRATKKFINIGNKVKIKSENRKFIYMLDETIGVFKIF